LPLEPTLSTLIRLRTYLRSGGRYGPSPFLLGHYGGIGDIAQGFCRAAAVSGSVYILSRQVRNISRFRPLDDKSDEISNPEKSRHKFNYTVDLDDFPDTLYCKLIVSPSSYVPPAITDTIYQLPSLPPTTTTANVIALARCIAIIDQPLLLQSFKPVPETESMAEPTEQQGSESRDETPQSAGSTKQAVDTAVFVFPPSSVEAGSATHPATVLINGEGSLSTPKGKCQLLCSLGFSLQKLTIFRADIYHAPVGKYT
jgi:hypothetical protein